MIPYNQPLGLTPSQQDDVFIEEDLHDVFGLEPKDKGNRETFVKALKFLLPKVGTYESNIVILEIMLALRIEGIVSETFNQKDKEMVKVIRDAIFKEPTRKKQALKYAQKVLKEGK